MRHAFVPRNLDMSLFGNKADKVALILDRMYRIKIYKDDYGHTKQRRNFSEPIALSMKFLKTILHENPASIMDMICMSKRHEKNGTRPIVEIIKQVRPAKKGERAAEYQFVTEHQVKAKIHKIKRTSSPVFKRNKDAMVKMIADWPEPYRKVCEHIKRLSLDMTEQQCEDLIQGIRNGYIQAARDRCIGKRIACLSKRYPNMNEEIRMNKATAYWDRRSADRIAELDEEHYDSFLFIRDKFCEMEGESEFPVYSLDEQGRLHYYLTNMPEVMRPFIRLDGCKMIAYDLGTSQCVFVWLTLWEYIRKNEITLDEIKRQAGEIMDTMARCGDGTIPDYVRDGFEVLNRKRNPQTLDDEMKELGTLLGKDFYEDIMRTIDWKRRPDGSFDRKQFKNRVLFAFLYGRLPSWKRSAEQAERKTMMHYFLKKFPAVYCVLWKMRRFTEASLDYYGRIRDGEPHLKASDYIVETYQTAEFPKEMQRREADTFFNHVIPLIDQPLVTIHDSIVVQAGKPNNIEAIIKTVFKSRYQISVRVSREQWYSAQQSTIPSNSCGACSATISSLANMTPHAPLIPIW